MLSQALELYVGYKIILTNMDKMLPSCLIGGAGNHFDATPV